MSRLTKTFGLAMFGFLMVACTVSTAQPPVQREEPKKGGFQGKGQPGQGGFGGGFGMRSQPGKIFSTFIMTQLKMTDDQKKQIEELQKEVDAKIAKILTEEQQKQLKEMASGRGGFGGGGFGGGQGGPGGNRKGGFPKRPDAEKKDN